MVVAAAVVSWVVVASVAVEREAATDGGEWREQKKACL